MMLIMMETSLREEHALAPLRQQPDVVVDLVRADRAGVGAEVVPPGVEKRKVRQLLDLRPVAVDGRRDDRCLSVSPSEEPLDPVPPHPGILRLCLAEAGSWRHAVGLVDAHAGRVVGVHHHLVP